MNQIPNRTQPIHPAGKAYKHAYVLLSGGLDSTTCLYQAINDYHPDSDDPMLEDTHHPYWVTAVSMDYGQRHHKEMEYAKNLCSSLGIEHHVLNLGDLMSGVMLTDPSIEVPNVPYAQIDGVSPTYVPFRNGTMLAILTAFAHKRTTEHNRYNSASVEVGLYFGAHAEDARNWAYPDCTPEFIGAMANAIFIGTYQQLRLHTPLMSLNKSEIVRKGSELGVPFEKTWSCYKGEEKHCGTCPTCQSRRQAFIIAQIEDPTEYAAEVQNA